MQIWNAIISKSSSLLSKEKGRKGGRVEQSELAQLTLLINTGSPGGLKWHFLSTGLEFDCNVKTLRTDTVPFLPRVVIAFVYNQRTFFVWNAFNEPTSNRKLITSQKGKTNHYK